MSLAIFKIRRNSMEGTLRLITSRMIKIIANSSKLLFYLFHFIFPKKRFKIPKYSPPLLGIKSGQKIPRILWQTNYTANVTLPVYINYLFNRALSPTYEYRFMTTMDRADFIKENCSKTIFNSYSKLQIGAAQADLWRLIVLDKIGGVYMDIDAHLVWPLNRIIKKNDTELYLLRKKSKGGITNYFIASQNNNIHLKKIINLIIVNINENRFGSVWKMTGAGVINKVLKNVDVNAVSYRNTCNQGNFTNEFFQYIDKPQGKWTKAQGEVGIIKK
jgi:mannosyltransferase OCH1-like enzyme